MNTIYKSKLKALTTHLSCSIIIACLSLYIVFFIWHPYPLAKAVGVTHIFLLMVLIDTITGPVLTFIATNPTKAKKLFLIDLSIIISIQTIALSYGLYSISLNRPVYIAFDNIRFELVQANDIQKDTLKKSSPPYNHLGWGKAKFVAVKKPINSEDKNTRTFMELQTGIAPSMQPDLYEPIEHQWSDIIEKAKSLDELYKYNRKSSVDSILTEYPTAKYWLPMKAFNQDMVILLDKNKIIKIVDLVPWND